MEPDPQPRNGSPPTPEQQPPPEEASYTHRGNGKVARLPKKVRDQIGVMILDGLPYANIIEAIGEHGKDLTEANIGNWKAASFKDWLLEYERNQALHYTHEAALGLLEQKAGVPVQDASRTIAAAQLYELLLSFDPRAFAAALANKPELYLRLINALSRLSEGEAVCGHRRVQDSLIESKLRPGEPLPENMLLSEEALRQIAHQAKLI